MKQPTNTASLLLDVGRIIRARMERGLPFSFAKCETLRLLAEEENPTMQTVARHFKITAPSATAIVNELVKSRLVTRAENAFDRREVLLRLTPEGKKTLRSIATKRKGIVSGVLSVLSPRDRTELDAILEKILKGIEAA